MRAAPQSARMDVQLIAPHISAAERAWVLKLLGEAMFLDMVAQQNAAVSNYNPQLGPIVQKFPTASNYEALWVRELGGLLELEACAVLFEALPFISAQIGSNGIFLPGGINNTPASDSEVRSLQDRLNRRAQVLQESIQGFLEKNAADYPLYPAKKCGGKGDKGSISGVIFY